MSMLFLLVFAFIVQIEGKLNFVRDGHGLVIEAPRSVSVDRKLHLEVELTRVADGRSYAARVLNVTGDLLETQLKKGTVLVFTCEGYHFAEGKYHFIPRILDSGEIVEWYLPEWASEPSMKLRDELPSLTVDNILKRLSSDDWGVVERLSCKLQKMEKSVIYEHRQSIPVLEVQKLLLAADHANYRDLYATILALRNELSTSVKKYSIERHADSALLDEGKIKQLLLVEKFLHFNGDSDLPEPAALGVDLPSQYFHLKALVDLISIAPKSKSSEAAFKRLEHFAFDPGFEFSDFAIEHLARLKRWNAVGLFDNRFLEGANTYQLRQLRNFCKAVQMADDATEYQKQLAKALLDQM